jgi:magnesium chelatase family protein
MPTRMRVQSYIRVSNDLASLQLIDVDLSLAPGLPQFHFIGLPDAALKESSLRIRSAIRAQGFHLPQAQSILVHLRPTHLKKTSHGLDLAVAAALLWETQQLPRPSHSTVQGTNEGAPPPLLYGELTLQGEVTQPDDIGDIETETEFITGPGSDLSFATLQIRNLKELNQPVRVEKNQSSTWLRPTPQAKTFSNDAALIASVVAAGEHSLLLAGPAGSGKSTVAGSIAAWVDEPNLDDMKSVSRLWRSNGRSLMWRPVLQPHHSITPRAMIGGGAALWPGEITRAHTGILIMDELLQFHPDIQESLREPVELGSISIVRAGASKTFPARALLLATTNLCDCGKFVPRQSSSKCRCSQVTRRRTLAKLSGPFVDRFHVIALTDEWNDPNDDSNVEPSKSKPEITSEQIARDVAAAVAFRKARGQIIPNGRLMSESLIENLSRFQKKTLAEIAGRSRRRKNAVVRVARTLADLNLNKTISDRDLDQAIRLSWESHRLIEEWHEAQ